MRLTMEARRHCPHMDIRGIYGDEINHTPGCRRLQCMDCGRLLDGPASIADHDRDAWAAGFAAGLELGADPFRPPAPNPYAKKENASERTR